MNKWIKKKKKKKNKDIEIGIKKKIDIKTILMELESLDNILFEFKVVFNAYTILNNPTLFHINIVVSFLDNILCSNVFNLKLYCNAYSILNNATLFDTN